MWLDADGDAEEVAKSWAEAEDEDADFEEVDEAGVADGFVFVGDVEEVDDEEDEKDFDDGVEGGPDGEQGVAGWVFFEVGWEAEVEGVVDANVAAESVEGVAGEHGEVEGVGVGFEGGVAVMAADGPDGGGDGGDDEEDGGEDG